MSVEALLLVACVLVALAFAVVGQWAFRRARDRTRSERRRGSGWLHTFGLGRRNGPSEAAAKPSIRAENGSRERPDSEPPESRRLTLPELRPKTLEAAHVVLHRPSPTRHPIVLAHGYLGFTSIGVHRARREYFAGVRERLEALGHSVYSVRVAPAGGVELRAAQLAGQIRRLREGRVNIIAHSMGGLDARYAIARLGLHDRVASLTTIGTPHRGTPLADSGALFLGEWRNLRQLLNAVGANVDGLYDMTTRRMAEFNAAVPDASDVYYSSVVGAVSEGAPNLNALLAAGHAYLSKTIGSNDGIVPAESQRWGEVLGEVDANHWEQIGWSGTFDARRFYALLAEHLAGWGL